MAVVTRTERKRHRYVAIERLNFGKGMSELNSCKGLGK